MKLRATGFASTVLIAAIIGLACGPLTVPRLNTPLNVTPSASEVVASATATLPLTPPTYTPWPTNDPSLSPTPTETPSPFPPQFFTTPNYQGSMIVKLGRGSIYGATLSHDGNYLIVSANEGLILFNADTFEQIAGQILPSSTAVTSLAVSPDDTRLAFGTSDGLVTIANLKDLSYQTSWKAADNDRLTLAWSPNGGQLGIGLREARQVAVVDTKTGEQVRLFHGWSEIEWAPDGLSIALIDGHITVIDAASGKEKYTLEGVSNLAWSPDSKKIYTIGSTFGSRYNYIWDGQTGKTEFQFLDGYLPNQMVAWSPDGKWVASGGGEYEESPNGLAVYDASTGERAFGVSETNEGVFFGPDNTVFSIASGAVTVWDLDTKKLLRRLEGFVSPYQSVRSAAWSPDGKTIVLGTSDNKLVYWDVMSRTRSAVFSTGRFITSDLHARWSSNGQKILVTGFSMYEGFDGYVWDTAAQGVVAHVQRTDYLPVIWTSDGSRYIQGTILPPLPGSEATDFQLELHDSATDSILRSTSIDHYSTIALSPDQTMIALAIDDAIVMRSASTGEIVRRLTTQGDEIDTISWMPDGSRFITGSKSGELSLWDVASGKVIRQFNQIGFLPTISPDGKRVAYELSDHSIELSSTTEDVYGPSLQGHIAKITDIAWSPDSTMIVAPSVDNTVIIWQVSP